MSGIAGQVTGFDEDSVGLIGKKWVEGTDGKSVDGSGTTDGDGGVVG